MKETARFVLTGLLAAAVGTPLGGCLDAIVGGRCADGFTADNGACVPGDDGDGGPDAGIPDGAVPDGSVADGGDPADGALPDGSTTPGDGGDLDGGVVDGSLPDGAVPDGGPMDGGLAPPCNVGELDCGGVCVLPDRDPNHCGGCDIVCDADQFCVDGLCEDACDPPFSLCAGLCVDYDDDPLNCGRCGRVCASGICTAGTCTSAAGHVVIIGHDFETRPVAAVNRLAGNSLSIARGAPIRALVWEGDATAASIRRVDAAFDDVTASTGRTWTRTVAASAGSVTADLADADAFVIYPQRDATDAELVGWGVTWATALDSFVRRGGVVLMFESGGSHDGTWQILDAAGLFDATGRTDVSGDDVTVSAPGDAVALGVPSPYVGRIGTFWFDTMDTTVVVDHADGAVVVHRVLLP